MRNNILNNNFETNFKIDDWFTFGYVTKAIKDIRKDTDGFNEYLLNDGRWVTGKYIVTCSD